MLEFLSNPIVGSLGIVFTILGIIVSVYLYFIAKKERKLSYYLYPDKTTILKSGQASELKIFHNEREINHDVTSSKMIIWNAGKESIKRGDVIDKIKIVTRPAVPILEASVIRLSRAIIDFSPDYSRLREGNIPLNWRILEMGDGAVMQLIYEGGVDIDLVITGVIVGQPKLYYMKHVSEPDIPLHLSVMFYFVIPILLVSLIIAFSWIIISNHSNGSRNSIGLWCYLATFIILFLVYVKLFLNVLTIRGNSPKKLLD